MILHEDLMYGNLIIDDKCGGVVTKFGHPHAYQTILNTCSPIPLTEEILKRIGFSEYDELGDYIYYRYWANNFKYKIDIRKDWCNSPRDWHVHIDNGDCCTIGCGEVDYVHELQNLVRVITGHELPITKEMVWEKE